MPLMDQGRLSALTGSMLLHLLFFVAIGLGATRCSRIPPQIPLAIEGSLVQYRQSNSRPQLAAESSAQVIAAEGSAQQNRQSMPAPAPSSAADTRPPNRAASPAAAAPDRSVERPRAPATSPRQDVAQGSQPAMQSAAKPPQQTASRHPPPVVTSKPPTGAAASADIQPRPQEAARASADRRAELQRALAAEESTAAAEARADARDAYRALLVQTIERNWIRPPSAGPGIECAVNVTQAPGGTVVDVKLGACNADAAVRESITNAVYRSSPLPAPTDPGAFERRLIIVFRPRE